ncbi:MAG: trypsin-like peptidase domain-containing protein [Saprospiraceae bacterium]|nr:trypsin-like peptidase domain-containing protein [Saprospiraceae bacterium]
MDIRDIINLYESAIVQIATPYSTGTGFYIKAFEMIITNEHVVRGNKSVVIAGKNFEKEIADIIYLDSKYDIAFLKPPLSHEMSAVSIGDFDKIHEGDKVIAIGHPFGLKYTVTQGIISSLLHEEEDVKYIQHDAALNPGNSGGPLVDSKGMVIGINTFVIQNGNKIGFSLPITYMVSCIMDFNEGKGKKGVRCPSCKKISFEGNHIISAHCVNCGTALTMISLLEDYEPYGVCLSIENMISQLGYPVALTRKGPNNWSIKNGSATVNISYYEKTGLLVGDVYMCTLPESNIDKVYYYLLQQNYVLQGLSFSVKDQDIILSLLIYDQYINSETMLKLFNSLLTAADKYDNELIEKFGAKWKVEN